MRKGYKYALIALGTLIIFLSYSGVTYSLWIKTFESNVTNTVKTGCFTIQFTEKTKSISLKNSYPTTDVNALAKVKPYTVEITNTCDTTDAAFTLTLNTVNVSGTKIDDAKIKYAIGENNVKPSSGTILSTALVNTETENINVSGTLIKSYIVKTGTIPKGTKKTFNLYLWVDDKAGNEVMNQKFQAGISVQTYSV